MKISGVDPKGVAPKLESRIILFRSHSHRFVGDEALISSGDIPDFETALPQHTGCVVRALADRAICEDFTVAVQLSRFLAKLPKRYIYGALAPEPQRGQKVHFFFLCATEC